MQTTAAVHCPGCGYDGNNPYFRYCGMCGSALRKDAPTRPAPPVTRPAPALPPALTVDTYSILGLQDQSFEPAIHPEDVRQSPPGFYEAPRHRADYLLDDDEPSSPRWRVYLLVVLLLIGAGALAWQWQGSGNAAMVWSVLSPASPRASHAAPAAEVPLTAENSPATPAPTPAVTPTPAPTSEATATPAATAAPATAEAPPAPAVSAAAPPTPVADDHAGAQAPSPEGTATEAAASAPNQTARADSDAAAEVDSNATSSTQSTAEAVPAAPKLATFSAADASRLLAEGQKYLYGNGVERDCGRALEDLRMAARLNAEAASLLGTMYASGHCVGQNLAPAYHWYARALHDDPANNRYKSDLEVLWNQMTPQQRQAALRIAP
jgi:hypothetical protein